MSKIEKRLKNWENAKPFNTFQVEEVESTLKGFGFIQLPKRRGSHNLRFTHELLKGHSKFGPEGILILPEKKGQVKQRYLMRALEAIKIIQEKED